jgi:hypothetical protein
VPAAVAYAVVYVGMALGATAATMATVATWILVAGPTAALLLGSVALSSAQRRSAERKARAAYNASQVDRLANVPATIAQRELVLGRVRKGGHVFFRGSTGTNKSKFVMLIALAGHEIDAVERIYLNDVAVDLDANGYVTTAPYGMTRTEAAFLPYSPDAQSPGGYFYPGNDENVGGWHYETSEFVSKARIRWVLGTAVQSADARMMELFPGQWTAAHRAAGVAYLICEFDYDETAFPSGLPNVTALVRGAKLFDPRTGTTAWSQNPALMARHIMLHPQFGKRSTLTAAEDARIIAAANACDVSHNFGDGAVPLYRAATVIPFGTSARDALDDIVQAMAGSWAYGAGEFHLRAGTYTAPVMSLGEADLAVSGGDSQQPISINTHRARNDKINVVTPRIWDAAQDYKLAALTPLKGAAYIAKDGAELVQEVEMPAVFYARQAQHVAGVLMRDARDPLMVTLPFKLSAYRAELFDTVNITLPRFGWSAKPFMVMGRGWTHDGRVMLTLKETSAAIFQPDAAFVAEGYAQNTSLPRPWDIRPPAIQAITSGTGELIRQADGTVTTRVRVQWAPIADASVTTGGAVEIQWLTAGTTSWQSVVVPGNETQAFILGSQDGTPIIVRARTRNSVAVSNWGNQSVHLVLGKTEPPPDVAGFDVRGSTLSWSAVNAVDLAGYQVRFNYGNNRDWGIASPLHTGLVTKSPWTQEIVPPGLITLMVKAQDTSGNQSAAAAVIVANLGDTILENLILTYDIKGAGFPGSIVNGAVVGGLLRAADSGDLFWGDDAAQFWRLDAENFWNAASYLALDYQTGYVVQAAEVGSRLTLDAVVDAASYTLDYRFDATGEFWGGDASYFWGSDASPFWTQPTPWRAWPGEIESVPAGLIQFRITTQSGPIQGAVSVLAFNFDVEDEFEELDNVAVSASGTRLVLTKPYRSINNVQLTLQGTGAAVTARAIDKSISGPLVACFNASGTQVAGIIDARIQGVKG